MKLSDWVSLVCFVIALIILWQFRQIMMLVFAAMVIAIALNSLTRRLMRLFHIPRRQAVLTTMGLVFLGLILFLGLVLPLFVGQFEQLLELIPEGFNRLITWVNRVQADPPTWLPGEMVQIDLPNFSDLIEQFANLSSQVFGNFFSFFSGSVTILLQLLLLVVLTVMMLSDPAAYRRLLLRLFPSLYRRRADEILSKCEWALLCWLGGVSVNSLFVAILSFAGLLFMRVPYPFPNAMLAGIFNFIPNIGPALSAIFPVSVALSQSFGSAITVILLYVVIQNLESYWFSPMMMQKRVALLPAATLVVQIFFATFLGPLGLILALPLAVVCKTWLEEAWVIDVLEKPDRITLLKTPEGLHITDQTPLPEQAPLPDNEA